MEEQLYTYGDKVKIVECYHPIWFPGNKMKDLFPSRVGKEGVIAGFKKTQGRWSYSIHFNGDSGPTSWFEDWQIEKISFENKINK